MTLRLVTLDEALAGLANDGMVIVGVLFGVATGLQDTGGMKLLAQRLLGHPPSLRQAQNRLMAPVQIRCRSDLSFVAPTASPTCILASLP